jgi:hypothetical protein
VTSGNDDNMASGNDDNDPIRRSCPASDSTLAPTPCTLWPSRTRCTREVEGDACTQGLVVSLSQNDPGQLDITTSIAYRVSHDGTSQTLGFGGREASRRFGNAAASINTNSPSDFNVRGDAYILARRLFVNWSDRIVGYPTPSAAQTQQELDEEALYEWMTNSDSGGRYNVDPILTSHGFLPCMPTRGAEPSGGSNLCSKQVPPPVAMELPKQCIPQGVNGNGTDLCCAGATSVSGTPCPDLPCAPANSACYGAGQGNCCGGAGATACTDQGTGNFVCN